MNYPLHPLCELLPAMSKAEFEKLRESIQEQGLLHPIVLFDDQVLDGRHRQQACLEIGIVPRYETYAGDDPAGYVAGANFERRKKGNAGQRVAFYLIASDWAEHAAGPGRKSALSAELTTQGRRARHIGVGVRTLQDAERLWKGGHHELLRSVARGDISLKDACALKFPPEQQRREEAPTLGDTATEEELHEAMAERLTELEAENERLKEERDQLAQRVQLLESNPNELQKKLFALEQALSAERVRAEHLESQRNANIEYIQTRRKERGQRPLNG